MKLQVEHTVQYLYSKPVFLEPHVLRLRPRNDPAQREISFQSEIDPRPSQYEEALDAEGNSIAYAWFDELTGQLTVRTRLEAETLRVNPFGFLLKDAAHQNLPLHYSEAEMFPEEALRLSAPRDVAIGALVRAAVEESGAETMRFLSTLSRMIFERAHVEIRHAGRPKPPAETVRTMRGACRDLGVLYNECCRSQGIAARFVSGYHRAIRRLRRTTCTLGPRSISLGAAGAASTRLWASPSPTDISLSPPPPVHPPPPESKGHSAARARDRR